MTFLNLQMGKVKKCCAHFVSSKKMCGMCQNDLWVNWFKLFLITETTPGLCERVKNHLVCGKKNGSLMSKRFELYVMQG